MIFPLNSDERLFYIIIVKWMFSIYQKEETSWF